jgi:hypothetical protein
MTDPRPGSILVPPGANRSRCRDCNEVIVWVRTAAGKSQPVAAHTIQVAPDDHQEYGLSHFADCKGADKFRRPRK